MSSSVIDSRNYGNFPDEPRTVQGTAIYDIGSPDSRTVPALTPSYAITACGTASGGNTAYTGTFTPSAILLNSVMEIAGFVTNPTKNNGAFQVGLRDRHDLDLGKCGRRGGNSRGKRSSLFPCGFANSRSSG